MAAKAGFGNWLENEANMSTGTMVNLRVVRGGGTHEREQLVWRVCNTQRGHLGQDAPGELEVRADNNRKVPMRSFFLEPPLRMRKGGELRSDPKAERGTPQTERKLKASCPEAEGG